MSDRPSRGWNGCRWLRELCCVAAIGGSVVGTPAADEGPWTNRVQIAISRAVLPALNETDAVAAIQAWTQAIAREKHIDVVPDPRVVGSQEELRRLLKEGAVDLASLGVVDYLELSDEFDPERVYSAEVAGQVSEQYIIVAGADSGAAALADLRGRALLVYRGYESSLVVTWLEVLLADRGLPRLHEYFGGVRFETKPSRAVLPLFFGKGELGVVTRAAYDAMLELNPQLRSRTKVIESSPVLVSTVEVFHRRFRHPRLPDLIESLQNLHRNPRGQQILTLFRADRMVSLQPGMLVATRELLTRYEALRSADGATAAARPGPNSP